jgi:hypothetical protein
MRNRMIYEESRGRAARLLALAVLPLGLAACGTRETITRAENRPDTTIGAPGAATAATLAQVLENPTLYTGKRVTVSAEVNDVLGPRAFTIGGEEFLPPGELLVVSAGGFPQISDLPQDEHLVDGDIVQVTGTVRTFVLTEIQRDIDPGLTGEAYVRWEGKPVLVVSDMLTTPRARSGAEGPSGEGRERSGSGSSEDGRTAAEVLGDGVLTARVKGALIGSPRVKALQIDVDVRKRVVTLTGTVETEAQKREAERIARDVAAVQRVVNRITVSAR